MRMTSFLARLFRRELSPHRQGRPHHTKESLRNQQPPKGLRTEVK
jgi:hypothetical protein